VSLDHPGQIQIVLAGVYFVFLNLSNLCGEKPVTVFVVLQLRRDLENSAQ
jgi:hypothetical protein